MLTTPKKKKEKESPSEKGWYRDNIARSIPRESGEDDKDDDNAHPPPRDGRTERADDHHGERSKPGSDPPGVHPRPERFVPHGPARGEPASRDLDGEVDERRHSEVFLWEALLDQFERRRGIVRLPGDLRDEVEREELLDICAWY